MGESDNILAELQHLPLWTQPANVHQFTSAETTIYQRPLCVRNRMCFPRTLFFA
jgi:hypothetical protein